MLGSPPDPPAAVLVPVTVLVLVAPPVPVMPPPVVLLAPSVAVAVVVAPPELADVPVAPVVPIVVALDPVTLLEVLAVVTLPAVVMLPETVGPLLLVALPVVEEVSVPRFSVGGSLESEQPSANAATRQAEIALSDLRDEAEVRIGLIMPAPACCRSSELNSRMGRTVESGRMKGNRGGAKAENR